jgi:hypothetical protein
MVDKANYNFEFRAFLGLSGVKRQNSIRAISKSPLFIRLSKI